MPEINLKMKKLIPEKITAYYKIECVYGVMAFTALLIAGCKLRTISINSSCLCWQLYNHDSFKILVTESLWGSLTSQNRHQHQLPTSMKQCFFTNWLIYFSYMFHDILAFQEVWPAKKGARRNSKNITRRKRIFSSPNWRRRLSSTYNRQVIILIMFQSYSNLIWVSNKTG